MAAAAVEISADVSRMDLKSTFQVTLTYFSHLSTGAANSINALFLLDGRLTYFRFTIRNFHTMRFDSSGQRYGTISFSPGWIDIVNLSVKVVANSSSTNNFFAALNWT